MKYRNFELRLIPLFNGSYNAVVIDSPHGSGSIIFQFPPALQLPQTPAPERPPSRDLAPESGAYHPFAQAASTPGAACPGPALDAQQLGTLLFESVFCGKVGDLFKKAHDPQFGLRIKLVLQDAANHADAFLLHSLPWELLYYEHHLAVSTQYSIVRALDGEIPAAGGSSYLGAPDKPRILMIVANPDDTLPLQLEREKRILTELSVSSAFEVEQLAVASLAALHNKLEEGFDVLHFMGHGAVCQGQPVLLFKNQQGGAEGISGRQLVEEIRGLSCPRRPRLFVLNACHGGAVAAGPGGLTGVAAELDRAGAPAVVAMRQEISDDSAICFSTHLYQALAMGIGLDEAMAGARLALKREPELAADWATPCLYANVADGLMFQREPSPNRVARKQRKFAAPVWLLALVLVLLAASVALFVLSQPTKAKRLVLEPLGANLLAGLWNEQTLISHLTGVEGLTLVKDQGDYVVQIAFEPDQLRAIVVDQHQRMGGEIMLSLPHAEDKQSWERLHAQLADRIFELLGLVEKGPPGWFLIDAATKSENNLGIALLAKQDLAAAEAVFRAVLGKRPSSAAANANLAMVLYEQGRYGEALTYAASAVASAPNVALFHYNLGLIQAELGHQHEAETSFEQALQRDNGFATAANALAKIYLEDKQWDKARALLEQALRYDPRLVAAHKNLGRCWLERGFERDALVHLQRALALVPTHETARLAEILYLIAKAQYQSGDDQSAKHTLERYRALPYVALLPGYDEALKLAQELGVIGTTPDPMQDPWPPATTATPYAIFTQVSGSLKLTQGDVSWYAQAYTALARGTRIEAGPHDQALLVCADGGIARLEGPGSWSADTLACGAGSGVGALFHALLQPSTGVGSIQGLLAKGTSAQFRKFAPILAPRGEIATLRPDLLWQEVEGASVYELRFEGDFNDFTSVSPADCAVETLAIGTSHRRLLRLTWPKEPLWPGCSTRVSIKAISGENLDLGTMMGDLTVLDEEALGEHQQLLQALEVRDEPGLLVAKVAICESQQLWTEAIDTQRELVALSDRFADKLRLAQLFLESDLDELARSVYVALAHQAKSPEQRAELAWGLGMLDHRAGHFAAALAQMGQARALYRAAARADKVIAVEYVMADLRTRI